MLRLLIEKVKLAVQKRTGAGLKQKTYADWLAKGYNDEPEVTFVIESHNKSVQVCHVVEKLRRWQPGRAELIVIDDGLTLEHTQRLAAMLTAPTSCCCWPTTCMRTAPTTRRCTWRAAGWWR